MPKETIKRYRQAFKQQGVYPLESPQRLMNQFHHYRLPPDKTETV